MKTVVNEAAKLQKKLLLHNLDDIMDQETSIRAIVDCPGGGRIVTLGFPGLMLNFDGTPFLDPERLAATMDHTALKDSRYQIALLEAHEIPVHAWLLVFDTIQRRKRRFDHLPIPDYGVPGGEFMRRWTTQASEYHDELDHGRTIGIMCLCGAGRSGTICARLLIERGMPPSSAIRCVRQSFAESIESEGQVSWLMSSN